MRQNYFVIDGKKYYTGTIFIVNDIGNQTEASFICYDTERSRYVYKIKDCIHHVDPKTFNTRFISVTDKFDYKIRMPVTKVMKDDEIDGLFLGWIWYIFLMATSTIFKGAIGLWCLISIVFFSWRKKKIEEEGTYIEW
jgi:hypothetical protein